jgi:hypothetical protein
MERGFNIPLVGGHNTMEKVENTTGRGFDTL